MNQNPLSGSKGRETKQPYAISVNTITSGRSPLAKSLTKQPYEIQEPEPDSAATEKDHQLFRVSDLTNKSKA